MKTLKLKELERQLSRVEGIERPSPSLEQYMTPAPVAASIVFDACMRGDVTGRKVADLGCGTGMFAIACMIMGASSATGFDIDSQSLEAARKNAAVLLSPDQVPAVEFRKCEVADVSGHYDTVFQNPPFGSQARNADVPFIRKAMEIGDCVYTMHLVRTRGYLEQRFVELGGIIEFEKKFSYEMPRMFRFHTRESRRFELILFKVVKIQSSGK